MGIRAVLQLLAIQCAVNCLTTGQEDKEVLKHTNTQAKYQNEIEGMELDASNFSHTPLKTPTAGNTLAYTYISTHVQWLVASIKLFLLPSGPTPTSPGRNPVSCQGNQVHVGGHNCSCAVGYTQTEASECQDIDECSLAAITGLQACGKGAECKNSPGSFSCHCPTGFVLALNGRDCVDVDECSYEESCRRELGNVCVNKMGSYKCVCQTGFREDKAACIGECWGLLAHGWCSSLDVDECVQLEGVCTDRGECENILGSYKCVCSRGYHGNGTHCTDVNECVLGVHSCDANARCGNIPGSYFCQCQQGYSGDGHSCYADVDECAVGGGPCEHGCINLPGAYRCVCNIGYTLTEDLHNCTDVEECVSSNGTCEQLCTNTLGSFLCSCHQGYQLHIDKHSCVDIDECKLQNGGCSHGCTNTPGGHTCHCFPPLLLDHLNTTCINVTSCALRNGGCDHSCSLGADGRLRCSCRAGWMLAADRRTCLGNYTTVPTLLNTSTYLTHLNTSTHLSYLNTSTHLTHIHSPNVDECVSYNAGCEQVCVNHAGSFNCACRSGFEPRTDEPTRCQPVCEPPCQNYGVCVAPNTCDCPAGYPGPGCLAMCSPPCAHGGTCLRWNTCLCPPGWTGEGCHTAMCELPCGNGGRCVAPHTCQCPSDYTGPQCLSPLCTPPCLNGGRCVDINTCICSGDWQGARCQIEPVQCVKPCKNGGVCVGHGRCHCTSGFMGTLCETAVTTPCMPSCQHGATCSPHNTCTCPPGTIGLRCEKLTCPVVTTVVSMARAVRKGVRESYADRCGPLGVQICTKYRIN
ncbi:hypothetical protein P4O66_019772, partial [Electrophorus voltai]